MLLLVLLLLWLDTSTSQPRLVPTTMASGFAPRVGLAGFVAANLQNVGISCLVWPRNGRLVGCITATLLLVSVSIFNCYVYRLHLMTLAGETRPALTFTRLLAESETVCLSLESSGLSVCLACWLAGFSIEPKTRHRRKPN